MTRTWQERTCDNVRCGECGGAVYITGTAPIFKGEQVATKCIRCTATGGWKWKTAYDSPKYTNLDPVA